MASLSHLPDWITLIIFGEACRLVLCSRNEKQFRKRVRNVFSQIHELATLKLLKTNSEMLMRGDPPTWGLSEVLTTPHI
jgi:hypothetical protein